MGSSAKRKKEKKQDFVKPKLKVGKTRPKATNATDTSFKAKSIVLNQQSLNTSAPSSTTLFVHQLRLTSSKSDSQRREALAYLTTAILTAQSEQTPLPQPTATILPKVQPLLLDASNSVRAALLKLLRALPASDISAHIDQLLLYIRAGMTHLGAKIRETALEALDWVLRAAGPAVVSCAGGWVKTLQCFLSLLGWRPSPSASAGATGTGTATPGTLAADTSVTPGKNNSLKVENGAWTSTRPSSAGLSNKSALGSEARVLSKQLGSLTLFLRAGLTRADAEAVSAQAARVAARSFPLCCAQMHMLGATADPFAGLNLFGAKRDVESDMYDDVEGRRRVFELVGARSAVQGGILAAKREGGEVGRAAAVLEKVLLEGLGAAEEEHVLT